MEQNRGVHSLQTREYDELIKIVREARIEMGMSQEQLSELLGQSINFMLKIETQGRRLDVVEFYQLSKALGLPPRTLFDRFLRSIEESNK